MRKKTARLLRKHARLTTDPDHARRAYKDARRDWHSTPHRERAAKRRRLEGQLQDQELHRIAQTLQKQLFPFSRR